VRANGGHSVTVGCPRAQDAAEGRKQPGQVDRFLFEEPAHVDTRRRAGPAERDDGPDLGEREPQAAALFDKGEDARDLGRIEAIAGRGPTREWQDPSGLVEPYRLAAGAALLGKLADEKSAPAHATHPKPFPMGQGQEALGARL
jgi:hypothetical protein